MKKLSWKGRAGVILATILVFAGVLSFILAFPVIDSGNIFGGVLSFALAIGLVYVAIITAKEIK